MTSAISYKAIKRSHPESIEPRKKSCSSLHTVGYEVYKSAFTIPASIVNEVAAKSGKAPAIFNHNESARNDNKRRQFTLSASKTSKAMKQFLATLNGFINENVSDILKPAPWVALHSKPGCQDQAAHTDFIPDLAMAQAPDVQIPLGVIVALMPGTRLNIWPNSIKLNSIRADLLADVEPIACEIVELNPGDMFVFRGDFVHAGSSYDVDNYRLHTFLDSNAVERTPNRTWLVHTHGPIEMQDVIIPKRD